MACRSANDSEKVLTFSFEEILANPPSLLMNLAGMLEKPYLQVPVNHPNFS